MNGWICGRNVRERCEVRSVLKVLRGGNTKTTHTGSPRHYWVVSRMACSEFAYNFSVRESKI